MADNIDIKVREDGSREAAVNIRAIGVAADQSTASVNNLNQAASGSASGVNALGGSATQATSAVTQLTQQTQNATQALTQYNQAGQSASQALTNFAIGATAVNVVTDAIKGLWDKLIEIPTAIYEAVRSMTELQAQVDKLRVGFKFGAGGDEFLGGANAQFINDMVQKLGLNINQTADAFLKFSAATRGTALQGETTREIFSAISEAATVLHLNADQVSRTFLALEQMASKGVVSMEELRRQLGDNLPGAFQIAARAMGMTTEELNKAIKSGQVFSDDFLPKFAEQVRKEFGGSVEEASQSAQASLGRFDTAWTNLKRSVAETGLGEAAKEQLDILTEAINGVTQAMGRARSAGDGFWGQFGAGLKSFGQWFVLGKQNSDEGLAGQIKAINDQLDRTDLDKFQRTQLVFDRQQALNEQAKRKSVASGDTTIGDSIRAATALAEQQGAAVDAARQSALSRVAKYNEGDNGKYLTKQENLDKAFKTINDEFKAATRDIDKGSADYAKAVEIAASRKQEALDKFNKAGNTAAAKMAQNVLGAEITEWQGYSRLRIQLEQGEQQQLATLRNEGEISEKEYLLKLQDVRENSLLDQQAIAEKEAQLASGRNNLSERQKYVARAAEIEQELVNNKTKTAEALTALDRKTRQAGDAALLNFQTFGDKRQRSAIDALGAMTQGGEAAKLETALRAVEDRASQERLRVDQNATKYGTKDSNAYNNAIAKIDAEERAQIDREKDYNATRLQMQADWSTGAIKAMADYQDKAQNVAAQTQNMFTTAFSGMEDALAKFATTGKLDFKSLVDSIMQDLIKMELRIIASQALSSLFGSAFGQSIAPTAGPSVPGGMTFSSGSLAGTGAWQTGGYTGDGSASAVAGLVHKGEYVVKADVVAQPGMRSYLENLNSTGTPSASAAAPAKSYGGGSGSGNMVLNVEIINNAGDKVGVSAQQGQDENGNANLQVMVDSLESQLAGRMQTGKGPLYKATQSAFGLQANPRMGG